MTNSRPTPAERDERVALPLDAETALRALLKVNPDSEPVDQDDDRDRRARSAPVVPDATPPRDL